MVGVGINLFSFQRKGNIMTVMIMPGLHLLQKYGIIRHDQKQQEQERATTESNGAQTISNDP